MEKISLHANLRINDTKSITVIYNLIRQSDEYDLECFVDEETYSLTNYCYIKGLTQDKTKGERIINLLAKNEVLPVHIHNLLEDEVLI